jgi:hypothetical protein
MHGQHNPAKIRKTPSIKSLLWHKKVDESIVLLGLGQTGSYARTSGPTVRPEGVPGF